MFEYEPNLQAGLEPLVLCFNGEEMTIAENDNGRGKVSYVNLRIITQITHSNTEGPHLAEFDCPRLTEAASPLSS